ncbi:RelA/SpoT domain-containing protein [Streptomyces sp. NPDC049555]|uniref:GTP pyrophosphokinase n=1 Tax=Streptomyces sp. NPDC049555 TaxID=3154930 RepID=UPI0034484672
MPDEPPFTYEEFSSWYDSHREKYLDNARISAVRALNEHLDSELVEMHRVRVRVSGGRVKSKERTWRKLGDKYKGRISAPEDVPSVVDDLVGLRIVCNNKSDVSRVMDIVMALPIFEDGEEPILARERDSRRNYHESPKPSGYRAAHINLRTAVSRGTCREIVRCELQVRTLLQDSWGELTHEDTYKPGGKPSYLVETISRRMADLLATLDEIGEDLRVELDQLSSEAAGEPPVGTLIHETGAKPLTEGGYAKGSREAAVRYLRDRWENLEKPIDLASLAWEMQRKFGEDIRTDWFGFQSFKSLLNVSLPEAHVTSNPPSYLLPRGFSVSDLKATGSRRSGVPNVAFTLKVVDRRVPLVRRERLLAAYEQLAEASTSLDWSDRALQSLSGVNELTRAAKECGESTRARLDYIAKALLYSGNFTGPFTVERIAAAFFEWIVKGLDEIVDLEESDLEELREWLI